MPTTMQSIIDAKDEYLKRWNEFKEKNPEIYTAASILPVTGQVAAVADYAEAMNRRDGPEAAMAALSFLPGVKLAKKVAGSGRLASKIAPSALELDIEKMFRPNSLRSKISPAVENAHNIGRAAAAEQVLEYGKNKAGFGSGADNDASSYSQEWDMLGP